MNVWGDYRVPVQLVEPNILAFFFFSFFLFLEIELCLHVGGRIEVEGPPLGGLGDQAGIVNLGGGNQRKTV